jgi:hypothetical protein
VLKGGVSAIDAALPHRMTGRQLASLICVTIALFAISVAPAFAGQASAGELFFYPCTSCHPIAPGAVEAGRKFPNDFKGHVIELVGHDKLGAGDEACLACHEDADRNPGMLKTIDGSLVEISGDVSLVCFRCHSAKYGEWKAGVHGRHQAKCTSAGCHDPHTPGWIYAGPLMPFVGTGFQFRVLPARQAFMPLMNPAPRGIPPVETPLWFAIVVSLGVVVAGGLVGKLILGRSKR